MGDLGGRDANPAEFLNFFCGVWVSAVEDSPLEAGGGEDRRFAEAPGGCGDLVCVPWFIIDKPPLTSLLPLLRGSSFLTVGSELIIGGVCTEISSISGSSVASEQSDGVGWSSANEFDCDCVRGGGR